MKGNLSDLYAAVTDTPGKNGCMWKHLIITLVVSSLYIDKLFCVGELHEQTSTTKHFQYIEILFQSRIVFFPQKNPPIWINYILAHIPSGFSAISIWEPFRARSVHFKIRPAARVQLFSCHRDIATDSTLLVHTGTANTGHQRPVLHWKHNSKMH